MGYSVSLSPGALRALGNLSKEIQRRIWDRLVELEKEPRPPGVKAMQGAERGLLRMRVGDYRVVYQVKDRELVVLVVRIGHRREVHR